jgi:lysophospholipase L1-like esterase
VLVVLLGLGIPRAFADEGPSPSYYVALGDSLAAGFQPVPDPTVRDQGYVPNVYRALASRIPNLELKNLGCDGATTTSLLQGDGCRIPYVSEASQLKDAEAFLRDHQGRVRLITIDIGGNDVNHCVANPDQLVPCATAAIGAIPSSLSEILGRLHASAPGVPIVGMTYYDPYLAAWLSGDQELASSSVQLTALLNATLAKVYREPDTHVADVAGAFGTPTDPMELVGAYPAPVATICAWTWMCKAGDIHPNDDGYRAIAHAFLAEIPTSYPQDAYLG